jgi:hypothetical protein
MCLIVTIFPIKIYSQNSEINEVDSLGTIWIITVDKSGSMLTGISVNAMATNVYNRLSNNEYLNKIDFNKDRFLFYCSGYSWNTNIGLGNEISKAPRFDTSFIHNTDNRLHSFTNKTDFTEQIKDIVAQNNYSHKLSFVSQIRVFSIVKAVEFLKQHNENKNFRNIKIINITDDADINDQWLTDYKNLKKWAPNKVEEVGNITSKYIYNILNGRGYGNLEEVFADEKATPHIWIYDYTTKQSITEQIQNENCFKITALDGESMQFIPQIDYYNNDKILFFRIDRVIVKNENNIVNQRFNDTINLNLNYENDFAKNKIQVFGSFQVQYTDSIWGEHYKKYYFTQTENLPTAYRTATISKIEITLFILLIIFLIYWLILLPNKKLFVIYSNQGKKYVVKRGYKHQWAKNTIPVLSCVLNSSTLSVICKKHKNIKTHDFNKISDTKNSFLICTSRKLFSDETVTENKISFNSTKNEDGKATDIEEFYNTRSREYSELLKNIHRKTLIFKTQNTLCNSSKPFVRKIGKIIVSTCNFFSPQYYYAVPTKTNSDISFRHSTLRHTKFVLEFSKPTNKKADIVQKTNINCLNAYYDEKPNERYDALICYDIDINFIYWNVIFPEYEKADSISLRYAYNIFQFKQQVTDETKSQIPQNLKLLKKVLRKQVKKCKKIRMYQRNRMDYSPDNIHDFEIREVSCPGFLYLLEDTAKQKSHRLYSPFKDGLKEKKEVFVKKFKTENCHLYLSFLPPNLVKNDNTLVKKVSDELIKTSENCFTVLEIKNQKQVIFKNINSVI